MKRLLFASAALVALAGCQTTSATPTERLGAWRLDWPQGESDLRPDPAIHFGRLENGMRYAIVNNSTPSNTVSFRLRFDAGSFMEDPDQRGLAHFLEHMAFNGTTNVPEGEMVRRLERSGLSFGAHTNAYTGYDETVYMLQAPNVEPETIDTAFLFFRELAGNMTIAPEAVDRERGVVLSEQRSRVSPEMRAYLAQQNFLFPNQILSERLPIGTTDTITNASAQRLRDFYEDYYRPERALLVIAGQVDVATMEREVARWFGDWRATRPEPGDPDVLSRPSHDRIGYFYDPGLPTSVSLLIPRPPNRAPDTIAAREQILLRTIGEGIVTRRLARIARQADAPITFGAMFSTEMNGAASLSNLTIASEPSRWADALQVAEQELRRAQLHGFTANEVREEIAGYVRSATRRAAQASTRSNSHFTQLVSATFNAWSVFSSPSDEDRFYRTVASRATPESVYAAFLESWGQAPRVFVATGIPIANAVQDASAVLAASERVAVSAPEEHPVSVFAYSAPDEGGEIVERSGIADLGITTLRFANNVRLSIKRTDFITEDVRVLVRFGSGFLELPREQPGLDMLGPYFVEGGLEAHTSDELTSLLAEHNVSYSFSIDPDAFSLLGATTPSDLNLQLEVLTAFLSHPGFRDQAMVQFRRSIATELSTLSANPNSVVQRDVPRLIRSGDSRFGIPDEQVLARRDFAELREAMERARNHGAIEIGIVGDVDVDRAISAVARTLGMLPTRAAVEPAFDDARRLAFPHPNVTPVELYHDGEANRAIAQVYWPTADDSDVGRVRTLRVLRAILRLKLIERIRETDGATYAPQASGVTSREHPDYGYIGVSLDLQPSEVQHFYGVVDEIVASMATGSITSDELERARRPLLEELPARRQDNSYWLPLVTISQSDPDALNAYRSAVDDYNAVTVASVTAAARQYLRPERAYRVSVLPRNAD